MSSYSAAFVLVFLAVHPFVSIPWIGLMVLTCLGRIGLLSAHIISCLVIAGSKRSSLSYRAAVGVMRAVQTLNGFCTLAIFSLTITTFGIPYLLPLAALHSLVTLCCLPMRSVIYLVDPFHRAFPSTSRRCQTTVVGLVRVLILRTKSLRERCELWAGAILELALPSSLLCSVINNTAADRFVLVTRKMKARLRPSAPVTNVAEVILAVALYYAKADDGAWMLRSRGDRAAQEPVVDEDVGHPGGRSCTPRCRPLRYLRACMGRVLSPCSPGVASPLFPRGNQRGPPGGLFGCRHALLPTKETRS